MTSVTDARSLPIPPEFRDALRGLGMIGASDHPVGTPLTGGVSSDVWRVDLAGGAVCLKRALPKLKVAADWRAPTERAGWEARWLRMAGATLAPRVLRAFDERTGVLVLDWLDPHTHPVWKGELASGRVDPAFAAAVGRSLAALHAAGARETLAEWEAARPLFETLRISPYLRATAERRDEYGPLIGGVVDSLTRAAVTVVHGDVSPKNILVGPSGPVFLDAECASPGDPAFDLAFCLNHLVLKGVWLPTLRDDLHSAAAQLLAAYLSAVTWESAPDVLRRTLVLLPALALARVDGVSPVEYLSEDRGRPDVRRAAVDLLATPAHTLDEHLSRWSTYTTKD
ncbi:phosphotransferase family protein [Rhodococcus sp. NPDC058505]|uniref:phosphotransferase family protein n=1 Tax=Rhodococcus sp. NPDC058505 TaxID=3346531 RepID=UPI0036488961